MNTFVSYLGGSKVTHAGVKPAQYLFAPVQQMGFRAQAVENAGKLDGNVTASHDHHPLRKGIEVKRFIGGDAIFSPRYIGFYRPAAGGDHNSFGADDSLSHPHLMRAFKPGAALHNRHTRVFKQTLINIV